MTLIDYEMDLTVITLLDGLKHNYFSYITWYKDESSPVGTARLVIPFDKSILKYWTNYYDEVIISAKLKNNKQNTNTKDYYKKIVSEQSKKKINNKQVKYNKKQKKSILNIFKQRIQNDEYNYSFIARIANIHRKGQKIIIDLEDIGWKFMQYVPDDFRSQYVAGQPIDDAFQAMCEFMGVEFAYSLDKLNEFTFAADGYSITKDNKTIESVPNFFEEIKNQNSTEEGKTPNAENEELQKLNKKLAKLKKEGKKKEAKSLAAEITNKKKQLNSNAPSDEIDNKNEKQEKYGEDFESRIKDLFIGNAFYESELTDTNYHYDAITITPKSTSSSTPTEYDNDPKTPQDTKKSMKKTKVNAEELGATVKRNEAIKANQNRWGNLSVNYSQTASQTSAPSPTNILAGRQRIEKQR